jgi:hypothetical protein
VNAEVEPIEVLLLTEKDCALCTQAREVLSRVAAEYPLAISSQDLADEDGRAVAQRAGVLFAPGILLDNEPFSYGRLSERKLRRELKRRIAARASTFAPPTT